MRTVIQIFLGIAIIILGYLVWESIMAPIRFNHDKAIRERAVITRMIDIREAQKAYKDLNVNFTSSFDTLIHFVKNDSFTLLRAIGLIPEELIDETRDINKAREIALQRGIIRREVTKISVLDSLFGKNYPVDSLRYVPYTDKQEFKMVADEYTSTSTLVIRVLEVSVPYQVFLDGLDPQLIINYAEERQKITNFPGLKFGSLTEGTLTGNWE
jgi:hypothetical protein